MKDETDGKVQRGDGEALWRLHTVKDRTGLGSSTIDRMERVGRFPARRRIGETAVGWLASEVIDWMRARPIATPDQITDNLAGRRGPSAGSGASRESE